jgi:hypothetical protein
MTLKPVHTFILCLVALAIVGSLLAWRARDVKSVEVSKDGVKATFERGSEPTQETNTEVKAPPILIDPTSDNPSKAIPPKSITNRKPAAQPQPSSRILSKVRFDTLELLMDSRLKTASLLVDGTEPEILEQTPLTIIARFRHAAGSRSIQLKNDKFTCTTAASFSGKKRLSITMSNCESN